MQVSFVDPGMSRQHLSVSTLIAAFHGTLDVFMLGRDQGRGGVGGYFALMKKSQGETHAQTMLLSPPNTVITHFLAFSQLGMSRLVNDDNN